MLINVSGSYGTGKTVLLVLIADSLADLQFYANFNIKLKNVLPFDLSKFLKNEYANSIILLDEAYIYLESRTSSKNLNRVMSYLLFQSRKVGIDIITTEQIENSIDIRFRTLCDIQINCNIKSGYFKYNILTNNKEKTITIPEEKMKKYFKLYDTNERVNHFEDLDEIMNITMKPAEKQENAKQIAIEICKLYKKPTISEIRAYFSQYNIKKLWFDLVKVEIKKILEENTEENIEENEFKFTG